MWSKRRSQIAVCALLFVFSCDVCLGGQGIFDKLYKYGNSGRSRQRTPAKPKVDAPCEWVKSLEEAKAAASGTRLIYMYFSTDVTEDKLPESYRKDQDMQAISKQQAVFVLMKIPLQPTPEFKEMMERYRVSGSGRAVITDQYLNPLVTFAEMRSASRLKKQLEGAVKKIKQMEDAAGKRYEQAESLLAKNQYRNAVAHLRWILDNCAGTVEAEAASNKVKEINGKHETEMKAIMAGGDEPAAKKLKLSKLLVNVHMSLPVYKQIAEAIKTL